MEGAADGRVDGRTTHGTNHTSRGMTCPARVSTAPRHCTPVPAAVSHGASVRFLDELLTQRPHPVIRSVVSPWMSLIDTL